MVCKYASSRDLNCDRVSASLILPGSTLKIAGPEDVKKFLRTVLMCDVDAAIFGCLHLTPCLLVLYSWKLTLFGTSPFATLYM